MVRKAIGRKGLTLLKRLEGCSLVTYQDVAGFPTIGYGHKLKLVESFDRITLEQAEILLLEDLAWAIETVNKMVKVSLNQYEFDALCIFVYNVGTENFSDSTLLKTLNSGDKLGVPEQMLRWVWAGGEKNLGLARRRLATAKMFIN